MADKVQRMQPDMNKINSSVKMKVSAKNPTTTYSHSR